MPLKTKIVLKGFNFDKNAFLKHTEAAATSSVYQSAREWVKAVIINVPVWTGQALGSVKYAKGRAGPSSGLFLGEYLKVAIPINPGHFRENKNSRTGGLQGRYTFSQSKGEYRFTYQTDIVYYIIQDFFNIGISPTAPWESMLSGVRAFESKLVEEMEDRLPTVDQYLLDTKVEH